MSEYDSDEARERRLRDLADLAETFHNKGELLEELVRRVEDGELTMEELEEKCKERQILLGVLY